MSGRAAGSALIVALGVLALLAVFAVSTAQVMSLEAAASSNYVLGIRARLLARAGHERAVAELRRAAHRRPFGSMGESWAYRDAAGTGPGAGIPLAEATNPSFRRGQDAAGSFSGVLGRTFFPDGDRYALRVVDTASQLHLGLPGDRLAPMLDTLGRAIREERIARGQTPIDPIAGRGAEVVALRDALGGFAAKEQLRELLDAEAFAALADHVSVHAWVDPTTSRSLGRDPTDGIPRLVSEPRAPIDVNTAGWPVLVAAFCGLARPGAPAVTYAQAKAVADEVLRWRGSGIASEGTITSWEELHELLGGLDDGRLQPEQIVTVEVAANPNLTLTELNPDRAINLGASKADLTTATTELTLMTMGVFEIESLGRVIGPDGRVLAEATLRGVVAIYDLMRLTTQAELERARDAATANAATFPSPFDRLGAAGASPHSGYVQLRGTGPHIEEDESAGVVMTAGFGDTLDASPAPAAGGTLDPDAPPGEGGDLFPDGAHHSRAKGRQLRYDPSAISMVEGSIELWFKPDRDDRLLDVPLFWLCQPIDDTVGIQAEVRITIDGDLLHVRSERTYYDRSLADGEAGGDDGGGLLGGGLPNPFGLVKSLAQGSVRARAFGGKGVTNEWHHLLVTWSDGVDQVAFIDGERLPILLRRASDRGPDAGRPPFAADLIVGSGIDPTGTPELRDVTVDDLVVRNGPYPGILPDLQPPPERYRPINETTVGQFAGYFPRFGTDVALGTLSWTEHLPKGYEDETFANRRLDIRVGLVGDGLLGDIDLEDTLEGATGLLGLGGLGGAVGGLADDLIDLATGGLVVGAGGGGPGVVIEGDRVGFVIRFVHERRDGLLPLDDPFDGLPILDDASDALPLFDEGVPINISPAVDDLTLTYRGPLRVLVQRWAD